MRVYLDVTEVQEDGKRHLVRHDGKGELSYDELLKYAHCISGDLGWCDIPDEDPASGGEGHRVVTCAYCGQEYPQDTPEWDNDVLTAHIKVCPKHPLRKAVLDAALLRKALSGLVGAETKEELEKMEATMRLMPAPEADKIAALNAIHALRETMPEDTTT